jgi:hypothetical protein
MRCRHPLLSVISPLLVCSLLSLASGCQAIDTNVASLLSPTADQAATPAIKEDAPTYYIEFRSEGGKSQAAAVPLTDVLYVQQALEQTKALKKYRRFKVEIYRPLPQGGGHRLPINYDRRKKRVDPGSDYAVHPQDRIVVTEDTSTVLDDMLEKLSG